MLDVLLWYLWMQAFALGGSLIASHWLRNLPDRGYGIGKALGILLGGFAYWIGVTVGFSQNNVGAVLLALAAVWSVGVALRFVDDGPFGRLRAGWTTDDDVPIVRRLLSVVIPTELLFALGFVAWAVVRAYSPDIVESGGEKFMESMMINAVLRSPTFPPNDAWLSGFPISYYYFGYVIYAMLIKVSGVAPSVGFNLGGAMIFALTLTSAFSVGFNLWGRRILDFRFSIADLATAQQSKVQNPKSAIVAGLLTAAMLALMGNLGGLMGALKCANALPQPVWDWVDIRDTADGSYTCRGLAPDTFYGWWWDWSRVIKDTTPDGSNQEVITEAPIFSFILGDNHPHVMALPFVLLALGLALAAYNDTRRTTDDERQSSVVRRLPDLILSSIVLGGLSFMNTWDFPVYGTLFVGATLLGRWLRREPLLPGLIYGTAALALGYLIYLPFYATFSSQARGIAVNIFNGTRPVQFFLMFAPFLVAGLGFLLVLARETKAPPLRIAGRTAGLAAGLVVVALIGTALFGVLSAESRALAQELQTTGQALGVTRDVVNQRLLARAANPWLLLTLGGGAALCVVLIASARGWQKSAQREPAETPLPQFRPGAMGSLERTSAHPYTGTPSSDVFALVLFAAGALLTLAVEFVFVRDLFGTRMNTVFKFYYIGWALWSVAGAYAIMRLLTTTGALAKGFGLASALLAAAGLLWPVMAVPARTYNFTNQPTLDGAAYLQRSHPDDAAMIDWLNKNVPGDTHLLEASTLGSYHYEGRISAFTGLPAVLGWGGHQYQWRGDLSQAAPRQPLVEQLYRTTDTGEARSLLHQFNVRYVIVGDTERGLYGDEGLAKFESMCSTALQSGASTIYDCE